MVDITKYASLIKRVLGSRIGPVKIKLNQTQREDLTQDCYLVLLENQDKLGGPDDEEQATAICRNKIADVLQTKISRDKKPRFVSADDPSVARHLERIGIENTGEISESELYAAIDSLGADKEVIRALFIDGLTQEAAAKKLNLSRRGVQWRQKRGIMQLRRFLEID